MLFRSSLSFSTGNKRLIDNASFSASFVTVLSVALFTVSHPFHLIAKVKTPPHPPDSLPAAIKSGNYYMKSIPYKQDFPYKACIIRISKKISYLLLTLP